MITARSGLDDLSPIGSVQQFRASALAPHGWIVFLTSGYKHLKDPEARSKDIGMSKSFTVVLGSAELMGGLGVISGVFAQLAAIGLILVMLGAIQKKMFVWHAGFWGKSGTNGWSYDTMLVVMNLIIVTTGGGSLTLTGLFR